MGIGAAWFGRRGRFFSIRAGGTLESSGGTKIKGGWNRIASMWSEDRSSDTIFATGLLVKY